MNNDSNFPVSMPKSRRHPTKIGKSRRPKNYFCIDCGEAIVRARPGCRCGKCKSIHDKKRGREYYQRNSEWIKAGNRRWIAKNSNNKTTRRTGVTTWRQKSEHHRKSRCTSVYMYLRKYTLVDVQRCEPEKMRCLIKWGRYLTLKESLFDNLNHGRTRRIKKAG